jgi:hypothetical protein
MGLTGKSELDNVAGQIGVRMKGGLVVYYRFSLTVNYSYAGVNSMSTKLPPLQGSKPAPPVLM